MAEPNAPKSGGGCLSKLFFFILLIATAGFATAIFFVVQPQDLTDLGGNGPAASAVPTRDLNVVLKNAIDRGYPVTLSETEINQWLGRTLTTKQKGMPEGNVSLDRVWVRLEDGQAEVIMARTFMGKPFTVSMFLQVERMEGPQGLFTEVRPHGGPFHPDVPNPPRGGRFGKLVVPQGFLLLVMPAYKNLAAAFPEEIDLGFKRMSRIRIENDQIIFDPRDTLGATGLPQTF